jgi:hypothetical protein
VTDSSAGHEALRFKNGAECFLAKKKARLEMDKV